MLIFRYYWCWNYTFLCFRKQNLLMFRRTLFLLTVLLFVHFSFSQVTTSTITGTVKDNKSQGLTGATVTAVHTPSGTTYSTIAGKDGLFTLPNVRIGGPYSIKITFTGLQAYTLDNVTLQLGQPFNVNAIMGESVNALETVVVTGRGSRARVDKTGASTNINNRLLN